MRAPAHRRTGPREAEFRWSPGNRSWLDIFKTYWPGVLGWGCIVLALIVLFLWIHPSVEVGDAWLAAPSLLLFAGLALSLAGTVGAAATHPPARRLVPIAVNISPVVVLLVVLYLSRA